MEPIVFIPGMMCDARQFGPQLQVLSRDRSVQIAGIGGADNIRDLATQVLEHAPERFALAGHSLGGAVAMEVVRRAPDRVSRLALISTDPLTEPPNVAAERDLAVARAKAGRLADVIRETIPDENYAPGTRQDAIIELVQAMALNMGIQVYLQQSKAMQRRPDQQGTLRRIAVPTLVLCGIYDRITPPRRHELMAELIPNAGLVSLDGAGHMPTLEQPQAVLKVMREWLAA